ncbi:hypothetical protein IJ135_00985 [Candidatus Saccharibacteria bacterium]|nr:hypothetical protein [Candidatus Saccharibacteria bacterium]
MGGDQAVEEGANTLLTLRDKIDTTRMSAPAFLAVVTATGQYAFRRQDEVFIVPIGTLGV